MDKLIDLAKRAVADYGFRQGVLFSPEDVAQRVALSDRERAILMGVVLEILSQLPNPVEPASVPAEQARMEERIRQAAGI